MTALSGLSSHLLVQGLPAYKDVLSAFPLASNPRPNVVT